MKRPRFIWIAVTADKYELPIAVADTAKQLGTLLGLSKSAVEIAAFRGDSGERSGRRFYKIPREDNEE